MRLTRCLTLSATIITGLLLSANPAAADSISWVSTLNATNFGSTLATPFDPSLGTLDRVDVSITGTLGIQGITPQNLIPAGPGIFVPAPYSYQVRLSQDIFGLGGRYFDLNGSSQFLFNGIADGVSPNLALATPFSYTFSFTSLTDLIGFAIPSISANVAVIPPTGVAGERADFVESLVPLNEIDVVNSWSVVQLGPVAPIVTGVTMSSLLQVTYNYTPAPPNTDVPEPATLWMLGTGAVALAAGRRRSRSQ